MPSIDKSTPEPDFTIIMPAYNRQELMEHAIDSIQNQTHSNWQLIVVDDCSPVPLTVPMDPRIRLLRQSANGGFSACANNALRHATGHYITFLSDDDAWSPHRLANALRAHEVADVAWCGTTTMGPHEQPATSRPAIVPIPAEKKNRELPESTGAVSVLRTACPLLDPSLRGGEDLKWGIDLRESDLSEVWIESPDFIWRRHDGPRNLNGTDVRVAASERLLKEYRDFYSKNPRIRAFRLHRIGIMRHSIGDTHGARGSWIKSILAHPSRGAFGHLAKSFRPR